MENYPIEKAITDPGNALRRAMKKGAYLETGRAPFAVSSSPTELATKFGE